MPQLRWQELVRQKFPTEKNGLNRKIKVLFQTLFPYPQIILLNNCVVQNSGLGNNYKDDTMNKSAYNPLLHYAILVNHSSTCSIFPPSVSPFNPRALHSTNSTLNAFRSLNIKSLSFLPRNTLPLEPPSVPINWPDRVTRTVFLLKENQQYMA